MTEPSVSREVYVHPALLDAATEWVELPPWGDLGGPMWVEVLDGTDRAIRTDTIR